MIEFTGDIQNLLRSGPKETITSVKRTHRVSAINPQRGDRKGTAEDLQREVEGEETEATGSSTAINVQYLPSGMIQINQEERQHIIDFFE